MYAKHSAISLGSAVGIGDIALDISFQSAPSGNVENCWMMLVFVPPGATALTRTPLPRYS